MLGNTFDDILIFHGCGRKWMDDNIKGRELLQIANSKRSHVVYTRGTTHCWNAIPSASAKSSLGLSWGPDKPLILSLMGANAVGTAHRGHEPQHQLDLWLQKVNKNLECQTVDVLILYNRISSLWHVRYLPLIPQFYATCLDLFVVPRWKSSYSILQVPYLRF